MPRSTLRRTALWPALCAAVSAWALDVPLTYVKHSDENTPAAGGFQQLAVTTAAPGGDYKLPTLAGPRYFAFASLGGEKRCFLFTSRKAGDPPYTRLFFDANGNRDLTDEPPIDEAAPPQSGAAYVAEIQGGFAAIDITVGAGEAAMPYSFVLQAFQSEPDPEDPAQKDAPPFEAYIVANCSYTGTLALGGKNYALTLGDGNANGLFGDKVVRAPTAGGDDAAAAADFFWISDGTEDAYWEPPLLADLLLIGDKLFRVTPALAARKLTLEPVTENLATVVLPAGLDRLTLCPDAQGMSVLMYSPAASVKLPPGAYRFTRYCILRKDAEGDTWQLHAEATRNSPPITISAEGIAAAPFGEPFTAGVVVQAAKERARRFFGLLAGPEKSVVRVNLRLEGAAKELVTMIAHTAGNSTKSALDRTGRRPKEPQYRIATTADETLVAGTLNYG